MAIVGNVPQQLDHRVKTSVPYSFSVDYGDQDPAGFGAVLTVRDRPGGLVFCSLALGSGIEVDEAARTFVVTLTPAQLALLPLASVYELILTPGGLPPLCALEGRILLDPSAAP